MSPLDVAVLGETAIHQVIRWPHPVVPNPSSAGRARPRSEPLVSMSTATMT
jgi:hypothetical protein